MLTGVSFRIGRIRLSFVSSSDQANKSAAWLARRRSHHPESMNRTGRPCTGKGSMRTRRERRRRRPDSTTGIAGNRCWSSSGSRRPPESSASSSSNSGKSGRAGRDVAHIQAGYLATREKPANPVSTGSAPAVGRPHLAGSFRSHETIQRVLRCANESVVFFQHGARFFSVTRTEQRVQLGVFNNRRWIVSALSSVAELVGARQG